MTVPKNIYIGVHSVVYELILFKRGMMKDSVELYILVLDEVILTFIQGHRVGKKLKLQISLIFQCMLLRLLWFNESHTHFISSDQYAKEREPYSWFCHGSFNIGLHWDVRPVSFKLSMMIEATEVYA